MATSVARKASMPAALALQRAWALGAVPTLCGSKVEPTITAKPLPSEAGPEAAAPEAFRRQQQAAVRSFKMHVGANISIPTKNARDLPQMQHRHQQHAQQQAGQDQAAIDPFEGLPFRGFAERLGERVMPTLEAAKEAERHAKVSARRAAEEAEVVIPEMPHLLPFTRWAAQSQSFRSTFIADPPKERKKARLSWYHPDDTMVPRDWFKGGLLEDLKYYSPFGVGSSK